jgi:RNA-binding protein Musashi
MFNRETHKSRGFGFVVFEDEASVDNVLQTAQHSIDGKMVEVRALDSRARVQVFKPVSHFLF